MQLFLLPSRVVNIKNNAQQLLNGLVSNSLDKPLNAFLNLHGRIIATCHMLRISDDEYQAVVPSLALEPLLAHLSRYAKLSKTQLDVSDLKAYWDLEVHRLLVTGEDEPSVDESIFTLYRLLHNMPLMGVDYKADEFILNVHEYDYTSYTKGCFLGQEPVAKVHHRSKPTRKLVVKYLDECTQEEGALMTSKIPELASGRIKGFVFVKNV